jgi:hypothetical protein
MTSLFFMVKSSEVRILIGYSHEIHHWDRLRTSEAYATAGYGLGQSSDLKFAASKFELKRSPNDQG